MGIGDLRENGPSSERARAVKLRDRSTTTMMARYSISPRRESLRRFVWRLDSPAGLVCMFSLAFLVRVLIGPHAGYYADLKIFQHWAERLAEVGPHRFYAEGWADYPPGYLYVLWLIGKISAPPGFLLLKLPAILGDLGLAWIAGTFAGRIAPASLRERVPVRAVVAAAVLFNPAVIMLSAVWGQVDVVPAMFVLWSLFLLFTGPQSLRREVAAFLLFAVAIAMKPQSGFVLPVMLYALYRRYLHRRPRSELADGALRIAVSGALSLGVVFLLALPFGLGPVKLLRFYSNSASIYPFTSANAFNLWGAVGFWRHDSAGQGHFVEVAGIPALYFGMLALVAGAALVLWRAHREIERGADQARVFTVAAAAVSLLAFALLTRMHERYMFYALAFLAPLVFTRALRLAFAGLSGLFVLNLWWVYAYNNSRGELGRPCSLPAPGCFGFDWIFGGFATDTWQKKVCSVAVTAIAIAVAWFGVRWAARSKPESGEPARTRSPRVGTPSLRSPLPSSGRSRPS
jgi:dolichyl-phosphate-mannose-protein mannosyltransferase